MPNLNAGGIQCGNRTEGVVSGATITPLQISRAAQDVPRVATRQAIEVDEYYEGLCNSLVVQPFSLPVALAIPPPTDACCPNEQLCDDRLQGYNYSVA